MRQYELMYILKSDLEEEAVTSIMEKFKGIVEQYNGEIVDLDKWGKRRLAYEIEDYKDGLYILMHYKGTSEISNELDRLLKINESVLRHIIIREDEK
ncbi:MAG: 30S ribosomal protein S6 [Firmicutes bacterium]|nr:30S ribosomal protein S6 [Bacillota bacterium]